jgi:hypothetical protein
MRITLAVGLAFVLLIAGCSNKPAPQDSQPKAGAAVAPAPAPSSAATAPSASTQTAATPSAAAARESTGALAPSAVTAAPATAVAKPSTTTAAAPQGSAGESVASSSIPAKPATAASPKAPAASPPPNKGSAPPAVVAKASPTLDISALTQRLKDTKAIGVLSKLALKNQVDDLLDQFRAFYQGKLKTTLAELRRPYDSLVLKVLALLQDGDPALASEIVASREAIWGILSDPKKFAAVA